MRIPRKQLVWPLLASFLAGGTVFGTCEARFHDALISSSKNLVFSTLNDLVSNLSGTLAGGVDLSATPGAADPTTDTPQP